MLQNRNLSIPLVDVLRMRKIEGTENEGEESVQTYITEPNFSSNCSLHITLHTLNARLVIYLSPRENRNS